MWLATASYTLSVHSCSALTFTTEANQRQKALYVLAQRAKRAASTIIEELRGRRYVSDLERRCEWLWKYVDFEDSTSCNLPGNNFASKTLIETEAFRDERYWLWGTTGGPPWPPSSMLVGIWFSTCKIISSGTTKIQYPKKAASTLNSGVKGDS